ncbi:MAG: arsenosugar biosynthesis radical SAM (seleno)protein ArsS [Synechococcus sp.]|nr:arsenosugar biosynthesis radical SAM (seleno)protein ArsS [Synechococcus sp.]
MATLSPLLQRQRLAEALAPQEHFSSVLHRGSQLEVLQLNLGRLCNMRCSHCHVDAGPDQGHTQMGEAVVQHCLAAMERLQPAVVDLTGGAPELHRSFRQLVQRARQLGCRVIDRCNLTVLLLPALSDLAAFLAEHQVEIVASLPGPEALRTDQQRGDGTFEASLEALRRLNALGYGQEGSGLQLTLMSNPEGEALQQLTPCDTVQWRQTLAQHGVVFNTLIGLNNMPIARFLDALEQQQRTESYLQQLQGAFNPCSLAGLMCRSTLSVSADGALFDCDFNQMLELPLDLELASVTTSDLASRAILTGNHCYGCTAGQGSSCSGATASSS